MKVCLSCHLPQHLQDSRMGRVQELLVQGEWLAVRNRRYPPEKEKHCSCASSCSTGFQMKFKTLALEFVGERRGVD